MLQDSHSQRVVGLALVLVLLGGSGGGGGVVCVYKISFITYSNCPLSAILSLPLTAALQ